MFMIPNILFKDPKRHWWNPEYDMNLIDELGQAEVTVHQQGAMNIDCQDWY